jgi:hypothetical protein
MDINPLDSVESSSTTQSSHLNTAVAIAVALLATFMGICKVKDDNIVQAMQQAQADKIDHWAFYQARNMREEVAKSTLIQLRLQIAERPLERQAPYQTAISQYEQIAREQSEKKETLRLQALADQTTYDALNSRDDQFDLSDALIAIAISLMALSALTQRTWLYGLGLVAAGFGVLMGLSGLAGWGIHPTFLIQLLS